MKVKDLLTESLNHEDAKKIIKKFLLFAQNALELESLPKIVLFTTVDNSIENSSFGGYSNGKIKLSISNRHINDCLRTLAHELVHFKQDIEERLDINSGETGSEAENEANALAAIIMRNWGKTHPQLFGSQAIE